MKLADNMDRHKILDEFEFRPDRTIDFWVTCPLVQKNPIFDLVRSIACLVLMETLWNLQIIWTGINSRMCSNFVKIRLFFLECQKTHIRFCSKSVTCVIFIQSLWNLQMNRTGIKYSTSWTGPHCTIYFGIYMPLIAGILGLRWAIVALLGNLLGFYGTWGNVQKVQAEWQMGQIPIRLHLNQISLITLHFQSDMGLCCMLRPVCPNTLESLQYLRPLVLHSDLKWSSTWLVGVCELLLLIGHW